MKYTKTMALGLLALLSAAAVLTACGSEAVTDGTVTASAQTEAEMTAETVDYESLTDLQKGRL